MYTQDIFLNSSLDCDSTLKVCMSRILPELSSNPFREIFKLLDSLHPIPRPRPQMVKLKSER